MKKLSVALLLGLSLSLTACGGSSSSSVNSEVKTNTTAGSAVEVNESVVDDVDGVVDDVDIEESVDNTVVDDIDVEDNSSISDNSDATDESVDETEEIHVELDEDDKKILADPNNFLTEEDLLQIHRNHEEIMQSIEKYRKAKEASAELDNFQLKDCYIIYSGELGIDAVSKKDSNILYIRAKDASDELSIGIYDKSVNEEGWQAVIDKNHKHEDSAGNVYYSAEAIDGGESYYAYEDGTLITFLYETGDIFSNIDIHK